MAIDALLFDKDGTLFDFAQTWGAFGRMSLDLLTAGDTEQASRLGKAIGFDYAQDRYEPDSVVIAGTVDEVAEALHPHLNGISVSQIVDTLNEAAAGIHQYQAVPLAPFLQSLRGLGLKLGVATNDAESSALQHLASVGVQDHFDFVAGYDSGHGYKPEPGQMLAFARHVNVDPSRVAMVGDSRHDLLAGRAAGMVTIGVLTGMAPADQLEPLADVVLQDIGHIPAWLATK
ncbi:HAD family hydrolase [Ruegeria sp. HKCCD7255]|uniref:HAD family hydrolase n=1 Tax=Ruegeria sp. HKCCD7255 TaxID=2683004 RepID=UPI001488D9B1|nr:HAD family hydrolase [Ruegeria sp. HKCCD7255]